MEISAKVGKDANAPKVTVNYDMPADLAGLEQKFGSDAIYNAAVDSITIAIQAGIRRQMTERVNKAGVKTPPATPEAIQAWADAYQPGAGVVRQTAAEKALAAVKTMTPEQRAALLAQLQSGS